MPKTEKAGASQSRSSAHRNEFPTGYSWRVALQQSPLPLRRSHSFCNPGFRWYTLFQRMEGVPFLVCLTLRGKCTSCPFEMRLY